MANVLASRNVLDDADWKFHAPEQHYRRLYLSLVALRGVSWMRTLQDSTRSLERYCSEVYSGRLNIGLLYFGPGFEGDETPTPALCLVQAMVTIAGVTITGFVMRWRAHQLDIGSIGGQSSKRYCDSNHTSTLITLQHRTKRIFLFLSG